MKQNSLRLSSFNILSSSIQTEQTDRIIADSSLNNTINDLSLNYLDKYDYRISGYTGDIGSNKFLEVLKKYKPKNYVILDDKHISLEKNFKNKNWVHVEEGKGLTQEDIEKAISTYFGPNQRFDKMGIEKAFKASGGNFETFKDFLSKGKQAKFLDVAEDMFKNLSDNKGLFHVKTKPAIDAYIKSLSGKPSLLKWEVVSDTLLFPSAGNPTKKMTEKIISTVMLNAGIAYELVSKEAVSESFRSFIMEQLNKLFK